MKPAIEMGTSTPFNQPDLMHASTPVIDKVKAPTVILAHRQPLNGYVIQPSSKIITTVTPNSNGYVTHSMLNVSVYFKWILSIDI